MRRRWQLHANILLEYENSLFDGHDSLPAVGHYHFGRHVVALQPPEDDRLGLYCVFDGFNADRCHGYIAHEASMDVCAEFIFVRQHGTYGQGGNYRISGASERFRKWQGGYKFVRTLYNLAVKVVF